MPPILCKIDTQNGNMSTFKETTVHNIGLQVRSFQPVMDLKLKTFLYLRYFNYSRMYFSFNVNMFSSRHITIQVIII